MYKVGGVNILWKSLSKEEIILRAEIRDVKVCILDVQKHLYGRSYATENGWRIVNHQDHEASHSFNIG